jgi:preprotein translocase subunit SecD
MRTFLWSYDKLKIDSSATKYAEALFSAILMASLFLAACSKSGKTEFSVGPKDLVGFAHVMTNTGASGTNATYVLHFKLTKAKAQEFRSYTQTHMNRQAQFLIGTKVVKGPLIAAEVSDGQIDLNFSSLDEARQSARLLSKTIFEVTGGGKVANNTPPSIYVDP